MSPSPEISVVIPVYNSERSLPPLVARLTQVLSGRAFEVVLVNDGSRDGSWQTILTISRGNGSVRGLNLMRNYGQHNALLAGIRAARGGVVVTMDDDLQHPPEEIPRLLAALKEGIDVVYGTPIRRPHSLLRNLASGITKLAVEKAMGAETARRITAFRAFRTALRDAFQGYRSPFVSIDVLLTWATSRFSSVEVEHHPREIGDSNYTWKTLAVHALTLMTGLSVWPLRLAALTGFAFTILGVGVLGYVLVNRFIFAHAVPGFAFLASSTAIFSGAQLFALGIMGEYLALMHVRLMDRPAYVIRESVGGPEP